MTDALTTSVSRDAAERNWTDINSLCWELMKTETSTEAQLLVMLWAERDGWTVRAQHEVLSYRVDLAIPEARLAVEVDGHDWHSTAAAMANDLDRQNALVSAGWMPYRCPASKVFVGAGPAARRIAALARQQLSALRQPRPGPTVARAVDRGPLVPVRVGAAGIVKALETREGDSSTPRKRGS
jgi:very-short-patch-repair endonuclease